MKAKIAAWLISLAMTINGGPIEPMETETTRTVPETKEIEIVEIETKEIETEEIEIIPAMKNTPEEHEGEILTITSFEVHEIPSEVLNFKTNVQHMGKKTWETVTTTWDTVSDKMTFWD